MVVHLVTAPYPLKEDIGCDKASQNLHDLAELPCFNLTVDGHFLPLLIRGSLFKFVLENFLELWQLDNTSFAFERKHGPQRYLNHNQ